jgi:peptidoglycan/LPS O-acetylase OafA/YrhL
MKHEDNFEWFDLFRGVAAIVVLIGHIRALSFYPYGAETASLPGKVFFFTTGFGHQAVVIFFVLSGFFIIRSIHEASQSGRWNVWEYLFNRFSRLWVVLLPALVLTLIWDTAGMMFFRDAQPYLGEVEFMKGISPIGKLGPIIFFGNFFFLQSILVPAYGTNGALWSLANEFWYYVLFPVIYMASIKYYRWRVRAALALIAIALIIFVGESIALYFIIWLMGGLLYILIRQRIRFVNSPINLMITVLMFLGVMCAIRLNIYPIVFNDFTLGLATVFLFASLVSFPVKNVYLKEISKFLSNVSYSVYVMHLSFSVFMVSFLLNERMTWSYMSFLYYLLIVVIVISYCVMMYYFFERNTSAIKKYLKVTLKPLRHAG